MSNINSQQVNVNVNNNEEEKEEYVTYVERGQVKVALRLPNGELMPI